MTPTYAPLARRTGIFCAVIGAMACAPQSQAEQGFPFAYFHNDCAPWDGPALTILLTHAQMGSASDASFPHLRLTLNRPPATLAGSSVSWAGMAQSDGFATLCESEEACTTLESASIRFDREEENGDRLVGEFRVEMGGGRVIAGAFDARRIPYPRMCGG